MEKKSSIEQIKQIGLTSTQLSNVVNDFKNKLNKAMQPYATNTTIVDEIHYAINQCISQSHNNLVIHNDEVLLMLPIWVIKILRQYYRATPLAFYRDYSIVTGYENKVILFNPNVSIYGKEPSLYNELDISYLLNKSNILTYEPHKS